MKTSRLNSICSLFVWVSLPTRSQTIQCQHALRLHVQLSVSRDGRRLAVGLENGCLGLLQTDEPHVYTPVVSGHKGAIHAVAVHCSM